MPQSAQSLHTEILRLLARGRLDDAAAAGHALNAAHPGFLPGRIATTLAELRRGRPAAALAALEAAGPGAARDPRIRLHRAYCLHALRRTPEAIATAAAAADDETADAALLDALGTFLNLAGRPDLAGAAYDKSVRLAPDNARFRYNRATVRRFLGDLTGAEADYERVIALEPRDYEAHKNLADLRPQTAERNHVERLERLLAAGVADWRGEVQLRHALAKEREDLGEHARSFEQLARGAALRRRHLQYDVGVDVATVDWIIEAFPEPLPAPGTPPDGPIFIVGLPRTGTTLAERILGCHPQVHGAGELNDFAQALVDAVRGHTGQASLPRRELVARSRDIDFAALGRDYLRRVRTTVAAPRFTDKMPANFLYCGLIRRALPGARIVHLRRQPMAACYAIFKTLFRDGYPFSYDLEELARYYAAYRRLMAHWQAVMPGDVYDLHYEALVDDLRGETARLLDHCGLAWDDACLAFDRNPGATTTASAAQVRRPLYRSSLAQWRHYAPQLDGLRHRLAELGVPAAELDL